MKKINYLMLLSGAALLLTGCPPPEDPDPPKGEFKNQILFDGTAYEITDAGRDYDGLLYLWFDSGGEDIEAWFGLPVEGTDIASSGTFTYAGEGSANYGEPGTFPEGGFYIEGTTDTGVVSGMVKVDISGDTYTVEADCVCEDGKKLSVTYKGALLYDGPTGTTTFSAAGMTFDIAGAEMYRYAKGEDFDNLYTTEIDILSANSNNWEQSFWLELYFFHSEAELAAGTYDVLDFFSEGDPNTVYGYCDIYDDSAGIEISGEMYEGKVKIAVSSDVYTITFEDVVLYTDDDELEITGAYTGTLQIGQVDSNQAKATPAKFDTAKPTPAKLKLRK